MAAVRRNMPPFVRLTCAAMVDALVRDNNLDEAQNIVRNSVRKLQQGDFKMKELAISAKYTVKKEVAGKKKTLHEQVFERMTQRTGRTFNEGDRVEYVIIQHSSVLSSNLLADRAEDVSHVIANQLCIDINYYLTVLRRPVKALLKFYMKIESLDKLFTN